MPPRIEVPDGQRRCATCKLNKPTSEFYESKAKRNNRGYAYVCKVCSSATNAAWYESLSPEDKRKHNDRSNQFHSNHRDRRLIQNRVRKYGISAEKYIQMVAASEGLCALCGKAPRGVRQTLTVDHDHACCPGEKSCGNCVRALLCHQCNVGLGHLGDDPDLLIRAAEYIRSHRKEVPVA